MKNKLFDEQLKNINKEEFTQYFFTHSLADTAEYFGLDSSYFVRRVQKFFQLEPKNSTQIENIRKQTECKHFGSLEAKKAHMRAAHKQTCLEKYGVEHTSKLQETTQKRRQTNQERFGADFPAQLDGFKEKMKSTKKARYGDEYYSNNEKCQMTKKQRYGDEHYNNSDKMRRTRIEKYGSLSYNNYEQISQTKKERYGDENYNNRDKFHHTMMDLYGVENSSQSPELRNKAKKRYTYNGIYFDSSWEIAFYIWALDMGYNIEHEPIRLPLNNNKGYYFPDFRIDGQLFEIKSSFWLKRASKEKRDCMVENKVIVLSDKAIVFWLDYIKQNYGSKYLKQFRNEQQSETYAGSGDVSTIIMK